MDQVVKAVQQAAGFVASQAVDAAGAIQHQAAKVAGSVVKPPPPSRDDVSVPDQAPAGPAQLETEEEQQQQQEVQQQPEQQDQASGAATESSAVGSKEDLGAREQGLMEDAKDKQLESHEIAVPSHEKFHTEDKQPQSLQGLSGSTNDEAAAGGQQSSAQQQGGQGSSSFEARTYKMTQGAETPAGTVQDLGVHGGQGKETEGAPLSGRTQMFDRVPQGGGATTSEQDRPVKLSGHDYKHETSEQQQQEEGGQGQETQQAQAPAASSLQQDTTTTAGAGVEGVELPVPMHDDEGDAAAGMVPRKGFEVDVSEETRGAETVDGSVKSLHLHTAQGAEGAGSKADQQLGQLLNKDAGAGSKTTAQPGSKTASSRQGANAAPSAQEGGVMRREGESEERNNVELPVRLHKEDGDAASGMVAHKESFEAEMAREARGAETVDGKVEDLGLHSAQGNEGAGSKADQQLGQFMKEGVQPPSGAHATTAQEGDAPVKMMPHDREEQGMSTSSWEPMAAGGDAAGSGTKDAASSGAGGEQQQQQQQQQSGDLHPRVLQPEGIKKLAQAIAEEQQADADAALLPESERAREREKNERMLAKAHEQGPPPPGPSVPGGDDCVGATAPSIGSGATKSDSGAGALSGGAGTGAGSGATEPGSTDAARERAGTAGTGSPATETETGSNDAAAAASGDKKETSSSAPEPEIVDARNIGQFGGAPGGVADPKGGGFSTGPVSNPDTGFVDEGTAGRKPEPATKAQDVYGHRR